MGIKFKYECKCGCTKDQEGHCDGSHEKIDKRDNAMNYLKYKEDNEKTKRTD
jgi:CDGSH-type Zn-finger protein|tara:strand:- start:71 stop:226 length:156 start_codon:yes stop_codon:yes gene_type:complete